MRVFPAKNYTEEDKKKFDFSTHNRRQTDSVFQCVGKCQDEVYDCIQGVSLFKTKPCIFL